MSEISTATSDPYDVSPSWVQRHGEYVAAAVVFSATVALAVLAFPPLSRKFARVFSMRDL